MDEPVSEAGDGWVEKKCPPYQPKALLFKVLALLWVLPSLTSLFILGYNWPSGGTVVEFLSAVRIEQWVAVALLLPHPLFVFLALRFRRTEDFKDSYLERDLEEND